MQVGLLASLVGEGKVQDVKLAFLRTIEGSFKREQFQPTRSEVTRRFDLCLAIFGVLRGDLKWSLPKCLDKLPHYLTCELLGVAYDPTADNEKTLWAPTHGGEVFKQAGLGTPTYAAPGSPIIMP